MYLTGRALYKDRSYGLNETLGVGFLCPEGDHRYDCRSPVTPIIEHKRDRQLVDVNPTVPSRSTIHEYPCREIVSS